MIAKQSEMLTAIKENLLRQHINYNDLLLENFFYTLAPIHMRFVIEAEIFASLFIQLIESIEVDLNSTKNYELRLNTTSRFVYFLLKTHHRDLKDVINTTLSNLKLEGSEVANCYIQIYEFHYLGCIVQSDDVAKQQIFRDAIYSVIKSWEKKIKI